MPFTLPGSPLMTVRNTTTRRWIRAASWLLILAFGAAMTWGCLSDEVTHGSSDNDEASDAGAFDVLDCGQLQEECDGTCVDPETDARHCGACNNACGDGEVCHDGSCETSCPGDQTVCDGGCFDLDLSPRHCGSCGTECDDGQVCSAGSCETSCGSGLTECDNQCLDLQTDPNHCGGCGEACPPSFGCTGGSCVATSDFPQTLSGLTMWLRSDSGITTDGGGVTGWQNRVDTDQIATQAMAEAQPAFVTGALAGKSVLRYDGDADHLRLDDFGYPDAAFTHVFAFVPRQTIDGSSDGEMRIFSAPADAGDSADLFYSFNRDDSGGLSLNFSVDDTSVEAVTTSTQTWYAHHPYIVAFSYDGTDARVVVNGELEDSNTVSDAPTAPDGFRLSGSDDGRHFEGDLAEMLIYDGALGPDELDALNHHLFDRYRLYFAGAPWIDAYPDDVAQQIENSALSESQIEHDAFQGISPADSCQAHLDGGNVLDGIYRIAPADASAPFEVYCDMTTHGGGWTIVWKNMGGPGSPEGLSDRQLWHETDTSDIVRPFASTGEFGSRINRGAWESFPDETGGEWLRIIRDYDADDDYSLMELTDRTDSEDIVRDLETPHEVILEFGDGISLRDLVDYQQTQGSETYECVQLDDTVAMSLYQDDQWYDYGESDIGFIRDYNIGFGDELQNCTDESEHLMADWAAKHVISYRSTDTETSSVRCQFQCWTEDDYEHRIQETVWGYRAAD